MVLVYYTRKFNENQSPDIFGLLVKAGLIATERQLCSGSKRNVPTPSGPCSFEIVAASFENSQAPWKFSPLVRSSILHGSGISHRLFSEQHHSNNFKSSTYVKGRPIIAFPTSIFLLLLF